VSTALSAVLKAAVKATVKIVGRWW